MNKKLLIGYHTDNDSVLNNDIRAYGPAKSGGGVDFLLCHFDPKAEKTVKENCTMAEETVKAINELGTSVIINFEHQNFVYNSVSKDGFDWANHPDGTHRQKVPQELYDALNSSNNLDGLMYDEFEHCIINRNLSIALDSKYKIDAPVFVTEGKDFMHQKKLLEKQISEYATELKSLGSKTLSGEHVFPVLFHTFAKNGIIPNFKSQKESFSNVQFAVAAGAALQYKTELWNCVDLWYRMTFPGHSANEMYHNLLFAYLTGVNRVYVEASMKFYENDGNGESPENEYGKLFNKFTSEYRNKDRDYDVSDFCPEIGIIRCDDTFWGQGSIPFPWKNMLFGNPEIKVKDTSREYIYVFNILTHGYTGNGGICSDRIEPRSLKKHRSFVPMNNVAVFDDEVREETIKGLKLCFLCGEYISNETLADVKKLVEDGLVVVTTKKYLPKELKAKGLYCEISDGKGKWIVVNDFRNPRLKKSMAPYIGKKDEMTYKFGDKVINMKISDDGESFFVK